MSDHDHPGQTPPAQSDNGAPAGSTGTSGANGAQTPASDWREAWRAARFSDDERSGQPSPSSHDYVPLSGEAARHGGPTGWLPADDLPPAGGRSGGGWDTGPQPATEHSSTRSATSTIDPIDRQAHSAGLPEGDASDATNGSPDGSQIGFRALLAQGLSRARGLAAGRVDVDPALTGGAAAGSLSASVAASMAAAAIPGIAPRPSPAPVPAPVAVAPEARTSTVPAVSMPQTERATVAAVVIPTGVPAVVPAALPVPAPVATAVVATAGAAVAGAAVDAAMVPPARDKPAVKPSKPARKPGRVRRAHLKVTRIDPWTVMKISFMLSIAFGIMTIVAVAVVWSMLDAAGVFTSINETLASVTGGSDDSSGFDLLKWVALDRVLGFTTLIAVVDVVLITALSTLGAFLYNLASALLGGVEVTLVEDQR